MYRSQEWICKGKSPPPQIVDIDDPDIPQDPSLISPKVYDEPDGPTQVLITATEGPFRSTIVRSQPDTYAPSMTVKRYEYSMIQLEIQVVLHTDAHMFV